MCPLSNLFATAPDWVDLTTFGDLERNGLTLVRALGQGLTNRLSYVAFTLSSGFSVWHHPSPRILSPTNYNALQDSPGHTMYPAPPHRVAVEPETPQ